MPKQTRMIAPAISLLALLAVAACNRPEATASNTSQPSYAPRTGAAQGTVVPNATPGTQAEPAATPGSHLGLSNSTAAVPQTGQARSVTVPNAR